MQSFCIKPNWNLVQDNFNQNVYPSSLDEICNHDNDVYVLLPNHPPESLESVLQRTLCCRKVWMIKIWNSMKLEKKLKNYTLLNCCLKKFGGKKPSLYNVMLLGGRSRRLCVDCACVLRPKRWRVKIFQIYLHPRDVIKRTFSRCQFHQHIYAQLLRL